MSAHLVLIDGLNLIRRIYAVQARPFLLNNELAENTQKQVLDNTLSSSRLALEKILSLLTPTHALVVFDSSKPCWRYDIFPDYKKGRNKMPEHLANKLNDIQDSFMEIGIDSLVPDQDEADDVIATLAVKVALRNQNVTIVSTDKSFLSMLCPQIKIYDYFHRRELDTDYVINKFNVKPSQLLDFWTLTGDTTNKIPGVPGIGQVTASALLQQYESLAGIRNADDLKATMKKKIASNEDVMSLAKKLLALKQDVPLGFNLKDIRLNEHHETI